MFPKSVQLDADALMITLPAKWDVCGTSYLVKDLLRQADEMGRYADAARAMMGAALDYMMSGPRWAGRAGCLSRMPNAPAWRVNDWIFYVLARLDDDALNELAALVRPPSNVDLIVPPWAQDVARSAVAKLSQCGPLDVYSIDTYVGQRVLWTSVEIGQRHSEALKELLQRYDSLVEERPLLIEQLHTC